MYPRVAIVQYYAYYKDSEVAIRSPWIEALELTVAVAVAVAVCGLPAARGLLLQAI